MLSQSSHWLNKTTRTIIAWRCWLNHFTVHYPSFSALFKHWIFLFFLAWLWGHLNFIWEYIKCPLCHRGDFKLENKPVENHLKYECSLFYIRFKTGKMHTELDKLTFCVVSFLSVFWQEENWLTKPRQILHLFFFLPNHKMSLLKKHL